MVAGSPLGDRRRRQVPPLVLGQTGRELRDLALEPDDLGRRPRREPLGPGQEESPPQLGEIALAVDPAPAGPGRAYQPSPLPVVQRAPVDAKSFRNLTN